MKAIEYFFFCRDDVTVYRKYWVSALEISHQQVAEPIFKKWFHLTSSDESGTKYFISLVLRTKA